MKTGERSIGYHHHCTPTMGAIADTLRATLRELAQADARLYRGLADELGPSAPALPAATTQEELAAAVALLRRHGYRVTPPKG
jgi:hypothetical protein